jgi:Domain of unknown function (DUF4136)
MKLIPAALAALAAAALGGCATPVGPVEVTRFHAPDMSPLGRGVVAIEPAPGMDGNSLEFRSYAGAVSQELARLGYSEQVAGSSSAQVASVRLSRETYRPDRRRNPVSVGVGGSTGSYGSGIGVGIGLDLSGPPPEQVETLLGVTIKDRASGQAIWEGKASFTVRATSPLASTQLGAAKLAEALFRGFPGQSGETIQVK